MASASTSSTAENQIGIRLLNDDLFIPNASFFWLDLLFSAGVGWSAFFLACILPLFSVSMLASLTVAMFALYRSLVFIHELAHLRKGALPGFTFAWNLLVGIPLLFPSFIYIGVHSDHHRPSSYGTTGDPEYLPFAENRFLIMSFLLQTFFIPGLLLFRFLLLSLVGLLYPPFHNFLEKWASSLTMNLSYCRTVKDSERKSIKQIEVFILLFWLIPCALILQGILSFRVILIWYVVTALISFINAIRTLGAHRYRGINSSISRLEQVDDSIDTPGAFWTELWAPVGLRYHALHHYYPSLPYHNLKAAYQIMVKNSPHQDIFQRAQSPSLWRSLLDLWCYHSP